jgi:hypothetical protein
MSVYLSNRPEQGLVNVPEPQVTVRELVRSEFFFSALQPLTNSSQFLIYLSSWKLHPKELGRECGINANLWAPPQSGN